MSNKPKPDEFEVMSDTPMTDLYWRTWGLSFGAGYGGKVYHGYELIEGVWVSFCGRGRGRIRGPVTAYKEQDISPVRLPCKRCLAVLRKAKRVTDDANRTDG